MKKKTVIMLLSLSIVLSGCGNAKATNVDVPQQAQVQQRQGQEQEQDVQQEAEQEEKQTEEADADVEIGKEYSNGDIVIKVENTEPEYGLSENQYENTQGTITTTEEVPIYCEQGYKIGHINPDVTVEITEHGIDSAWYRFENPVEGTQYNYIYVSMFMADLSNVEVLPGTIREGDYKFEIKDEYTRDEAQGIFSGVLEHYGMIANYTKFDSNAHNGLMVEVPLKDTVKWAEEKKDLFMEHGVTYYNMEGYGYIPDVCTSVFLQIKNDEKEFTKEEIAEFFKSDVDLELQEQILEYDKKMKE